MDIKVKDINKLIVVGDRLLIKKRSMSDRTKSGLLLPPGVTEKEDIQSGYVILAGPGYPVPTAHDADENWKKEDEKTNYIPLQAKIGDLAVFLQKQAIEIEFNKEKFFIVPNSAVLLLYRED